MHAMPIAANNTVLFICYPFTEEALNCARQRLFFPDETPPFTKTILRENRTVNKRLRFFVPTSYWLRNPPRAFVAPRGLRQSFAQPRAPPPLRCFSGLEKFRGQQRPRKRPALSIVGAGCGNSAGAAGCAEMSVQPGSARKIAEPRMSRAASSSERRMVNGGDKVRTHPWESLKLRPARRQS